jgi:histidinol-phosphate aminotransferase
MIERNVIVMGKFEGSAKKSVLNISPYIPGKPIEEVQREHGIKNVIKLASNENPLGPSKLAVNAMKKKLGSVNLYPESSAYYLRKALARKLKVNGDMLVFGNGSNELLNLIAGAFVEPGEEVMFSALSFIVYPIAADTAGGVQIQIPHREFRHDVDGFIKRLSPKTKLVYLCNPNNPTGAIITKAEFEKFMSAVSPKTIVALDEAYFEFVDDPDYPDGIKYLARYPNLIVLRTFSKIYGLAGLRIGYGIAGPDVTGIIERVRPPFNANLLAQYAAEAALRDKKHVEKTIESNAEGRKYLYSEFSKLGIEYVKTHANFIFVKFKSNSKVVFEALLKEGVIIRPQFDSFARITIGTMKENIKLVKSLKKIL